MLIPKEDGKYIGGPLDVLCILHDVSNSRYHAAFFEEHPMPGPVLSVENTKIVRLKSKMHHTAGAASVDEAREHMKKLRETIIVPDENVCEVPIPWDGTVGIVWVVPSWKTNGMSFGKALGRS